jgi:hypothetical protein
VFIGEQQEFANYKNYWEEEPWLKPPPKTPEEEKAREDIRYFDEKYDYVSDFGETLVGKKRPAIFVYDTVENQLFEMQGLSYLGKGDVYPACPLFDENSKGIIFCGIHLPIDKRGLSHALNRNTVLYYVRDPVFDTKPSCNKRKQDYVDPSQFEVLNNGEYLAVQPRFSVDYSKLLYYSKPEEFLSHTTNYELRYLNWPKQETSHLAVPSFKDYPNEKQDFVGLYGHNLEF